MKKQVTPKIGIKLVNTISLLPRSEKRKVRAGLGKCQDSGNNYKNCILEEKVIFFPIVTELDRNHLAEGN